MNLMWYLLKVFPIFVTYLLIIFLTYIFQEEIEAVDPFDSLEPGTFKIQNVVSLANNKNVHVPVESEGNFVGYYIDDNEIENPNVSSYNGDTNKIEDVQQYEILDSPEPVNAIESETEEVILYFHCITLYENGYYY